MYPPSSSALHRGRYQGVAPWGAPCIKRDGDRWSRGDVIRRWRTSEPTGIHMQPTNLRKFTNKTTERTSGRKDIPC